MHMARGWRGVNEACAKVTLWAYFSAIFLINQRRADAKRVQFPLNR